MDTEIKDRQTRNRLEKNKKQSSQRTEKTGNVCIRKKITTAIQSEKKCW